MLSISHEIIVSDSTPVNIAFALLQDVEESELLEQPPQKSDSHFS